MCQFKSALVIRDERSKKGFRIFHSSDTDSHSQLIELAGLREDTTCALREPHFARIEYSPTKTKWDVGSYKLILDELRTPTWYTTEMAEEVTRFMTSLVMSMVVQHHVTKLTGGPYILGPNAKVDLAIRAHILSMHIGATITKLDCSQISVMEGGHIFAAIRSNIDHICEGALIESAAGLICLDLDGTIGAISGGSVIDQFGTHAVINTVQGNLLLGKSLGNGTIKRVDRWASLLISQDESGVAIEHDERKK